MILQPDLPDFERLVSATFANGRPRTTADPCCAPCALG